MLSVETTQLSFVYQAARRDVSIENATQVVQEVVPNAQVQEKTTEILSKTELTWSEELYVGSNTMIALTVVGGVVFVVVLILIYCCCCRKKSGEQTEYKEQKKSWGGGTGEPLVIPISVDHAKYR